MVVMECRAGSWQVGGGAFAWCHGRWCCSGAHMQWVGVVELVCCVEVLLCVMHQRGVSCDMQVLGVKSY